MNLKSIFTHISYTWELLQGSLQRIVVVTDPFAYGYNNKWLICSTLDSYKFVFCCRRNASDDSIFFPRQRLGNWDYAFDQKIFQQPTLCSVIIYHGTWWSDIKKGKNTFYFKKSGRKYHSMSWILTIQLRRNRLLFFRYHTVQKYIDWHCTVVTSRLHSYEEWLGGESEMAIWIEDLASNV